MLKVGAQVVKNKKNWVETEFDSWGRGEGVGVVVEPPFELLPGEYDIRWPHGRCFEFESQISEITKRIEIQITIRDRIAYMTKSVFESLPHFQNYEQPQDKREGQMWKAIMTPDLTPDAWYFYYVENGKIECNWINLEEDGI